jgi:ATP-dependent Clp endopeptidase proteolytic subunit ClpP
MSIYILNVNPQKRESKIQLYGQIGGKLDGDAFARELLSLDSRVDVVHLHINSPGGDVIQGLSIISAMRQMKAAIHVHVDGIASSMAAVIAVCGDKVSMMDYSKLMVHDPFFSGTDSSKLSPKQKKSLDSITDTLRTILSRRGKSKEEIARLMGEETWFTADEAKSAGLIDEVVSSKHKDELIKLSTDELLNRIAANYSPNHNNNMDLSKIAKELGLPENATEAEILAAIKKDKDEKAQRKRDALEALLVRGVKVGLVKDTNREKMEKFAETEPELFEDLVKDAESKSEGDKETPAATTETPAASGGQTYSRLSQALADLKAQGGQAKNTDPQKTWDWYQKNDPQALLKMENDNPDLFNKLRIDYENSL